MNTAIQLFDKYDVGKTYKNSVERLELDMMTTDYSHFDCNYKRIKTIHCLYSCFNIMDDEDDSTLFSIFFMQNPKLLFNQIEHTFRIIISDFIFECIYDETVIDSQMNEFIDSLVDVIGINRNFILLCMSMMRNINSEVKDLNICYDMCERINLTKIFDESQRGLFMKFFNSRKFLLIRLFVVMCNYVNDTEQCLFINNDFMINLKINDLNDLENCFKNPLFELCCSNY
jgi:hypothetical protein